MVIITVTLFLAIAAIILLTTKLKLHPFFALLFACVIVGTGIQLPAADIIAVSKDGFGNILKSLGFILVLGTTLGVILEYSGATLVMASYLLRKAGEKKAPFAMSLTGFMVGLPIFCDSGFIVLSGLNKALSRHTARPVAILATSMATGLYAVHCLIPPHPGATAAAITIGADLGKLILLGTAVAIPAMLVGNAWAKYAGRNEVVTPYGEPAEKTTRSHPPTVWKAFLPIIVPLLLIAAKSFFTIEPAETASWIKQVLILGDPVPALFIGNLLAMNCKKKWKKEEWSILMNEGVEKAGNILIIIGAGGAFGAVLMKAGIGGHLKGISGLSDWSLLVPFLITFFLKTAQGSSTVAIITASAIVQPLLPTLGITSETDKILCVLAMGAGSMMISHANDAYFWVIAKFSDLPVKTTLKIYSTATIFMALTSLLFILLLDLIL